MSPTFLKKPVLHIANFIYESDTEEGIGFIVYCIDSQKAGGKVILHRTFHVYLYLYLFLLN